jgi:hypothetical protein
MAEQFAQRGQSRGVVGVKAYTRHQGDHLRRSVGEASQGVYS